MTSLENYNSMLKSGIILKSEPCMGDGVFLSNISDLKNKYPQNALNRMIRWYGNTSPVCANPDIKSPSTKIVILQVPIEETEKELYKWRPISLGGNNPVYRSQAWNNLEDFCLKELKYLHSIIPVNKTKKIAEINVTELIENSPNNLNNLIKSFWKQVNIQSGL